jgi:4-amino-4-deoxy-L-arabinose transferase-like glycosyltransferase
LWSSQRESRAAFRFLWCWIGTYFVFFSVSSTKLPNYVLPLYPPLALLTAYFFDRWRVLALQPPAWLVKTSLACLALMGAGVTLGFLIAGGVISLTFLHGRSFPELRGHAILGAVLMAAAVSAWWYLRRGERGKVFAAVASAAVLFVGCLGAWVGIALNAHKAPQQLADKVHGHQKERDIRIGCYDYFQPSLVFYSRREVERFQQEQQARDFLESPLPVYLYIPGPVWDSWQATAAKRYHVLGRARDLYRNCEVVVVTNR